MGRRSKEEMKRAKERAKLIIEGSTISISECARRVGVSATTLSKWLDEWGFKRWF